MTMLEVLYFFGADGSLSARTNNLKNHFLILGEGDIFGINENFGTPEQKA